MYKARVVLDLLNVYYFLYSKFPDMAATENHYRLPNIHSISGKTMRTISRASQGISYFIVTTVY